MSRFKIIYIYIRKLFSNQNSLISKVISCQTDLCNTPQDKIYRIENAVLCENGWYL
jgi:hypothetical protein